MVELSHCESHCPGNEKNQTGRVETPRPTEQAMSTNTAESQPSNEKHASCTSTATQRTRPESNSDKRRGSFAQWRCTMCFPVNDNDRDSHLGNRSAAPLGYLCWHEERRQLITAFRTEHRKRRNLRARLEQLERRVRVLESNQ